MADISLHTFSVNKSWLMNVNVISRWNYTSIEMLRKAILQVQLLQSQTCLFLAHAHIESKGHMICVYQSYPGLLPYMWKHFFNKMNHFLLNIGYGNVFQPKSRMLLLWTCWNRIVWESPLATRAHVAFKYANRNIILKLRFCSFFSVTII